MEYEVVVQISTTDEIDGNRKRKYLYERIKEHMEDLRVIRDEYECMSLSCLIDEDKIGDLTDLLREINTKEGFSVALLSGPWGPYNFLSNTQDKNHQSPKHK